MKFNKYVKNDNYLINKLKINDELLVSKDIILFKNKNLEIDIIQTQKYKHKIFKNKIKLLNTDVNIKELKVLNHIIKLTNEEEIQIYNKKNMEWLNLEDVDKSKLIDNIIETKSFLSIDFNTYKLIYDLKEFNLQKFSKNKNITNFKELKNLLVVYTNNNDLKSDSNTIFYDLKTLEEIKFNEIKESENIYEVNTYGPYLQINLNYEKNLIYYLEGLTWIKFKEIGNYSIKYFIVYNFFIKIKIENNNIEAYLIFNKNSLEQQFKDIEKITYFIEYKTFSKIEINFSHYNLYDNKTLNKINLPEISKINKIISINYYNSIISVLLDNKDFKYYNTKNLEVLNLKDINFYEDNIKDFDKFIYIVHNGNKYIFETKKFTKVVFEGINNLIDNIKVHKKFIIVESGGVVKLYNRNNYKLIVFRDLHKKFKDVVIIKDYLYINDFNNKKFIFRYIKGSSLKFISLTN